MSVLFPVQYPEDIFPQYRDTPIAQLLEYHNLNAPFPTETSLGAQLLVGMCMDFRVNVRLPERYAYFIRTGGANLKQSEFHIAYALSVGGVEAMAIISHSNCGMVDLGARQDLFVERLVDTAGAAQSEASELFVQSKLLAQVGEASGDEFEFVVEEARWLRSKYPKILIAALHYKVEDNLLYQIRED